MGQSAERGASPILYAAASPDLDGEHQWSYELGFAGYGNGSIILGCFLFGSLSRDPKPTKLN